MSKQHQYKNTLHWTGNKGTGTSAYTAYSRDHVISIENKTDLQCWSDAAFRGDATRHNPEDLFLASLSSCHMLWYLHLCADAGVVVTAYTDRPEGVMEQDNSGAGRFTKVTLHPEVIVADESMIRQANALHEKANAFCFIANSVGFKIEHEPVCRAESSVDS